MTVDPTARSAPLPPHTPVEWAESSTLWAELQRAQVELLHAIKRHRLAWAKMERLKAEAEGRGNAYFMDNDRPWKLATGDVTWWRGEVNARSNSVLALTKLLDLLGGTEDGSLIETTSLGDPRRAARTFMPRGRLHTDDPNSPVPLRGQIMGWTFTGTWPPPVELQNEASAWMLSTDATFRNRGGMTQTQWEACKRVLRAPCICNNPPPTIVDREGKKNGQAVRPPGWSCPKHGQII